MEQLREKAGFHIRGELEIEADIAAEETEADRLEREYASKRIASKDTSLS